METPHLNVINSKQVIMSKYSTYLDNILLPVELAKKGKGHRSVMANFSVGV